VIPRSSKLAVVKLPSTRRSWFPRSSATSPSLPLKGWASFVSSQRCPGHEAVIHVHSRTRSLQILAFSPALCRVPPDSRPHCITPCHHVTDVLYQGSLLRMTWIPLARDVNGVSFIPHPHPIIILSVFHDVPARPPRHCFTSLHAGTPGVDASSYQREIPHCKNAGRSPVHEFMRTAHGMVICELLAVVSGGTQTLNHN
jgi:hypothetical protein